MSCHAVPLVVHVLLWVFVVVVVFLLSYHIHIYQLVYHL